MKYTETILSNSSRKLLWLEITKMLIADCDWLKSFTENSQLHKHSVRPLTFYKYNQINEANFKQFQQKISQ